MKRRSDEEISAPLYEYDAAIRAQYGFFAGVDEAGRGPLCGPSAAGTRFPSTSTRFGTMSSPSAACFMPLMVAFRILSRSMISGPTKTIL